MAITQERLHVSSDSSARVEAVETIVTALRNGLIFDAKDTMYPSTLDGYVETSSVNVESKCYGSPISTCYGLVIEGSASLKLNSGETFSLPLHHYFSIPDTFEISGMAKVSIIERFGYRGTFMLGGPLEQSGRLCYIDGCSDTLLISPHRLGDPCLNLLTFPRQTKQTFHLHPSVRLGTVVWGEGRCVTAGGSIPLTKGQVFYLPERLQHCFHTDDQELAVVAYHPDSDWGPTDAAHPMINRTYINR